MKLLASTLLAAMVALTAGAVRADTADDVGNGVKHTDKTVTHGASNPHDVSTPGSRNCTSGTAVLGTGRVRLGGGLGSGCGLIAGCLPQTGETRFNSG